MKLEDAAGLPKSVLEKLPREELELILEEYISRNDVVIEDSGYLLSD